MGYLRVRARVRFKRNWFKSEVKDQLKKRKGSIRKIRKKKADSKG